MVVIVIKEMFMLQLILMPGLTALPAYQVESDSDYLQKEFEYFRCSDLHLAAQQQNADPSDTCKKHLFWIGVQMQGAALGHQLTLTLSLVALLLWINVLVE